MSTATASPSFHYMWGPRYYQAALEVARNTKEPFIFTAELRRDAFVNSDVRIFENTGRHINPASDATTKLIGVIEESFKKNYSDSNRDQAIKEACMHMVEDLGFRLEAHHPNPHNERSFIILMPPPR